MKIAEVAEGQVERTATPAQAKPAINALAANAEAMPRIETAPLVPCATGLKFVTSHG